MSRHSQLRSNKRFSKELDDYTCQVCCEQGEPKDGIMTSHHIVPVSEGGQHDRTNLITLCLMCHQHLHRLIDSHEAESKKDPSIYTEEILKSRYGKMY